MSDGRTHDEGAGGIGEDTAGPDGEPMPTSGLRNPAGAVRGVASVILLLEAVVLLMALVPIAKLGGGLGPGVLAILLGLVVVCVATCGVLSRSWGWYFATAVQIAILATGFLQGALFVVGGVFLAVWIYALWLKSSFKRPARFDH